MWMWMAACSLVLVAASSTLSPSSTLRLNYYNNMLRAPRPHMLLSEVPATAEALTPREVHIADVLQLRLRASDADIIKLLVKHPQTLNLSEENIVTSLDALQAELGVSEDDLQKIVLRCPPLLGLNVELTVLPRLRELADLLGLDARTMGTLVRRNPAVLTYDVAENVVPTVDALHSMLTLSERDLGDLVLRFPQVIGLSVKDNLRPSIESLRQQLGADEATLGRLIAGYPPLLGLRVDAVAPKLRTLADSLRLSPTELQEVVLRHPAVMGASLDRCLRPNLALWTEQLGGDTNRLRTLVLKHGLRFLCCSYDKRSQPRIAQALAKGVEVGALPSRMRYTDTKYDEWLASLQRRPILEEEEEEGETDKLLAA